VIDDQTNIQNDRILDTIALVTPLNNYWISREVPSI